MTDWLYVFCLGLSIDIFYTLWVINVSKSRSLIAATCSVLMYLPGVFGLFGILEDKVLLVPYCTGLFVGTVSGMKLGDKIYAKVS